jgi:hypothetical protein
VTPSARSLEGEKKTAYRETHVEWPSLKRPVYTNRTMRLGSHKVTVRAIILVNSAFYIASEDVVTDGGKVLARRGDYLWRNLELTRRKGFDPDVLEDQCFARFTSIYTLHRGAKRIPIEYEWVRIPKNLRQHRTIRHLMQVTWTLHKASPEGVEEYVTSVSALEGELVPTRNGHTRAAGAKMFQAKSVTDRRGRKNPGRLPPLHWSAMMQLDQRDGQMRCINVRMNKRALVAAYYLDQILKSEGDLDDAVVQLIEAHPELPTDEARRRDLRNAERLERYAAELRQRPARPSQRSWVRAADDLEYAARCLRIPGLGDWREPLRRVHNSRTLMLGAHRRLEEVLFTVARVRHAKDVTLSQEELIALASELEAIEVDDLRPDLEVGFKTKPVAKAEPFVRRAIETLKGANGSSERNRELITAVYELIVEGISGF